MHSRHLPDAIMFDFSVIVGKNVALSHDFRPWDFRVLRPEAFRDPARRFADDLDLTFDSGTQHEIVRIFLKGSIFRKIDHGAGSGEHIPEI